MRKKSKFPWFWNSTFPLKGRKFEKFAFAEKFQNSLNPIKIEKMATQKFPLFQWKNQEFLISLNPNNIEEMATQKIPQFQFKFGYPEIPWG